LVLHILHKVGHLIERQALWAIKMTQKLNIRNFANKKRLDKGTNLAFSNFCRFILLRNCCELLKSWNGEQG
jgi:hypothetical protein